MPFTPKPLYLMSVALLLTLTAPARAQQEGPTRTQTLVAVEGKTPGTPTPSNVTIKVDNRATPLTSMTRVVPTGAQVALLIDDGLRNSVGRELNSMRAFVQSLPSGTEILIGYMQNGRVVTVQNFTSDLAGAAASLRIPEGIPGQSASPYLCLSDFLKQWPRSEQGSNSDLDSRPARKASFVLMITDGVDPYNGSTSPLNQDSPYVSAAATDAQRSGVPIYSIYYSDAGIRGGQANASGQNYLSQIANATGGRTYYLGGGNPVSLAPFFAQFQRDLAETYIATFDAPGNKNLVRIKFSTNLSGTKLRSSEDVQPGMRIANPVP